MPPRDGAAIVDHVPKNCPSAAANLRQSELFLTSGQATGVHREASYVLLYESAKHALDAVLASAGRRVTEGRGAHALRIREAKRILGREHAQLLLSIDDARTTRNRVSYQTQSVSEQQLTDAKTAAAALFEVAKAIVADNCP